MFSCFVKIGAVVFSKEIFLEMFQFHLTATVHQPQENIHNFLK